jgi:ATP-binding cassette subfamily B protein
VIKLKKFPLEKQDGQKDCGPACLSMIIKYYGGYLSISKIRDLVKTNRNGTNAYDLLEGANQIGFTGYGLNYNLLDEDNSFYLPAIAHVIINFNQHFLVVYEINRKKKTLYVADPATGKKKMSFEEFNKISTNKWLILYPNRPIVKEKRITFLDFIKTIANKKQIILLTSLSLLEIIISLIFFTILKQMLETNFSLLIFFIIIIKYLIIYLKDNCILKYSLDYQNHWMEKSFSNILSLPYAYYRNRTTGEMVSRINDIENMGQAISIISIIGTNIILIIITSIFLFKLNSILFLISLFFAFLYIIYSVIFSSKIKNSLELLKQDNSILNSYMTEAITGFESVKGQNLESNIISNFKSRNKSFLNTLKSYQKQKNKIYHIRDLTNDFSLILLFTVGIYLENNNLLTYSNFILFYTLFNFFLDPFKNLIEIKYLLDEQKISFKRIMELNTKEEEKEKIESGIIRFKNTTLEKNNWNLKNINLSIYPKDKIMIIGHSGSGKSTLLKHIKQYYQTNNIYINNQPLKNVSLKEQITYISQNEILFTDTLYNNITMGSNIDNKTLNKIIKICRLNSIIKRNPLGIMMLIEENGFNLSGGEKQRIILARALSQNKNYLFIDEGLGEVDTNLERKILKDLFKYYQDKTILFVTHRLDNMDLFSKVIKFDKEVELIKKEE